MALNCVRAPVQAVADGVGVLVDNGVGCEGVSHLGPAGYYLRVNAAGDGLEWAQTHEPVHLETGDAPFEWDDDLQCGCIPLPGQLTDNGDGTFTFDPGDGTTPTTLRHGWTEAVVNGSVITFAYPDGSTLDVDVCALIAANCNATLVDNGDGTFTHMSNSGVQTTFQGGWTEVVVNGSVLTFTFPNGATLDVDVCVLVASNCDVSLVNNGDGTYTHRSIGGVQTTFPGGWTSIVDNGDSTLTITYPDGTTESVDICALVAANCDATLIDNGDGTFTHTSNSGVQTTFSEGSGGVTHPAATLTNNDAPFAWDDGTQTGNIPVTTLTENADGTVTVNPGNGDGDVTIHAPVTLTNNDAPFSWDDGAQTGNIPLTTVTENGDNTITINPGNGDPDVTFCDGIVLDRPNEPTVDQLARYDDAVCTLTIPLRLSGFKGRVAGSAPILLPDGAWVNVTDLDFVATFGTTADTDMSPVGNRESLVLPVGGLWQVTGNFVFISDVEDVVVTGALVRNGVNWAWESWAMNGQLNILSEMTFTNHFIPAGDTWGLAVRADGTDGVQLGDAFIQVIYHRV